MTCHSGIFYFILFSFSFSEIWANKLTDTDNSLNSFVSSAVFIIVLIIQLCIASIGLQDTTNSCKSNNATKKVLNCLIQTFRPLLSTTEFTMTKTFSIKHWRNQREYKVISQFFLYFQDFKTELINFNTSKQPFQCWIVFTPEYFRVL